MKGKNFVYDHFYRNKWHTCGVFLTLILEVGMDILMAFIFGAIIDTATLSDRGGYKNILFIALVFFLIRPFVSWLYETIFRNFSVKITQDIRKDIFMHLMEEEPVDFYRMDLGEKLSVLTNDCEMLDTDYIRGIFRIAKSILLFLFATLSIFLISVYMGTFLFTFALISIFLSNRSNPHIYHYKETLMESKSDFTTNANEYFMGYEVAYDFSMERTLLERIKLNLSRLRKAYKNYYASLYLGKSLSLFLGSVTFMGGFLLGAYLVLIKKLSVGNLILCIQLSNNLTQPVYQLVETMGEIKSARAVIKKIRNIFRQNVEPNGEIPTEFREAIEIQNVTYQYEEEGEKRFSLEPVCEKIYPGEKILIIGASGSGKSTLLKLLYKRLTPQEGKLLLDGKDYQNISSEGIKKIFSILHQEVFLFKGSLRENLSLFRSDYSREEMERVLNMVELGKFIPHLDEKDFIAEQGKSISGGERQRIAIARALLKNAPVLLADEIFSALDNETAVKLEDTLLKIPDKTIISISHRLFEENLCQYDALWEMENGKLTKKI